MGDTFAAFFCRQPIVIDMMFCGSRAPSALIVRTAGILPETIAFIRIYAERAGSSKDISSKIEDQHFYLGGTLYA